MCLRAAVRAVRAVCGERSVVCGVSVPCGICVVCCECSDCAVCALFVLPGLKNYFRHLKNYVLNPRCIWAVCLACGACSLHVWLHRVVVVVVAFVFFAMWVVVLLCLECGCVR